MATRQTVATALAYAQALVPHLEHQGYRCDDPWARRMGKGCSTCGVEVEIAIADFRRTGDLEVFEKEMKPHLKKRA
ncbi:MAG: hypothetical protein HZB56_19790 [Deltaproteobacteria bacterium]|nr:hypothetical protein [Deltaproteobacteria bacterium]